MASADYSHWWQRMAAVIGAILLAGQVVQAQPGQQLQPKANVAPSTAKAAPTSAPAPRNQLSPQKMEEALRMLLRADSVASQRQRARLGPESSGLVVDQTITKIGHDFYDEFYSRWEAPPDINDFIITIGEKPSRGNNAIVTMTVNDEDLLEFPLQNKPEIIEEAAQQAIGVAASFLQQALNLSRQLERGNKQALETY